MFRDKVADESTKVACDVCLREVPASEARSEEASDYVMYFCGLECYGKWRKQLKTGGNKQTR
jgi:hypothetical protein